MFFVTSSETVSTFESIEFLIDGERYYSRLRQEMLGAENSICISGWDVDSRLKLDPVNHPQESLYHLFRDLLSKRPQLQVYILCWNYNWFLSFERELWPWFRPHSWGLRVHFVYDSYHPPGGAKHEKFILIDQKMAFVGGIDLCEGRWDQPTHLAENKLRRFSSGAFTQPFHDIQALLTGHCLGFLIEYFSERWTRKSKVPLPLAPPICSSTSSQIPEKHHSIRWLMTQAAWKDQPRIRTNLRWTLYLIRTAEKYIYIENQYLTSRIILKALTSRLSEEDGPEIICVLPEKPFSLIDSLSMGILRRRSLRALLEADIQNRLRLCYPTLKGLQRSAIYVHTKLLICDDQYLKLGSCNLNNRSLSLDQEIDFMIDSPLAKTLLLDLLSEHTGSHPDTVREELSRKTFCQWIDERQDQSRTLQRFTLPPESMFEDLFDHDPFFDSYRHFTFRRLFARLIIGFRNFISRKPTPIKSFLKRLRRPRKRFPWTKN